MIFNVHAGHAPFGIGGASGAVGILNESNEARKVKNAVIIKLREKGHTVYDCTCDKAYTQNAILSYIVNLCNEHKADLDISIHLNSGRNDYAGDASTGGVEVYGYNEEKKSIADRICMNISNALNIRNRGFKINQSLYVLRKTVSPALLIECCFVDDKDDANAWNADKCADAIVKGILGEEINEIAKVESKKESSLHYRAHVENIGWDTVRQSGEVAGTTGQSKRLEAIKIDWPEHEVEAAAHIEDIGWKDYGKINRDTVIGTTGQSKRLECLRLKGNFRYRVHIAKFGWSAWIKADGIATLGTVGQALSIEAIQIEELIN